MKDTQSLFTAMLESKKRDSLNRVAESQIIRKVEAEEPPVEFEGTLVKAQSEVNTVADDILDNIQVVTDPEKTVDELEVRADEVKDAIEGSPEGEAAFSDEYVGDKVYACPICGESFFADDEYEEGDTCPICKAEPTEGFLLQGVVAPIDTEVEEPAQEPEVEDEAESESEEAAAEPTAETEAEESETEESEDETALECKSVKESVEAELEAEEAVEPECEDCFEPEVKAVEETSVVIDLDDNEVEVTKRSLPEIDEESFEEALNEFAAENYANTIENIDVQSAEYDEAEDALELECVAECKNGKKVPLTFKLTESFYKNNRAILNAVEKRNVFKVESKGTAMRFKVVNNNGTIRCESMKYKFETTHSTAGKVKVEGFTRAKKRK